MADDDARNGRHRHWRFAFHCIGLYGYRTGRAKRFRGNAK